MTKLNTTLSAVVTFENASENAFADNYQAIYKPFFVELRKRTAYFEQQKGVKGNQQMKLAYDVKNGIRNKQGDYCFNPDKKKTSESQKQFLSFASKFAAMPEKELLKLADELGGNTIGTLYKNMSTAKTASTKASPKVGAKNAKTEKQSAKNEKSADEKNLVLSAFNSAINGIGENMTSAQFASILIALAPIAEKQFANCEAKQIRAILENPAIAEKLAKTA
jgi:hypothetical protein